MTATDARRCWAEIDLDALRYNAHVARKRVGSGVQLLAVIKADGYGHGLAAVAKALRDQAQMFGVANLAEAIEAREIVPHPIVILGPALPSERAGIVAHHFIPSLSSLNEAQEFSRAAVGSAVAINCAIDTGMGRMGLRESEAVVDVGRIAALPNLEIHSISSHLPAAEDDATYTRSQLSRFRELVTRIRGEVPGNYLVHTLPSAGLLGFADSAFDIVRAGLMLYGSSPDREFQKLLRPVMALKSRVALVRDLAIGSSVSYGRTFIAPRPTRVATLSCGYADGFPRSVSNRDAAVLIGGQRCTVIGRVTMDLTMIDVTDLPSVSVGDEAVLIGRQGKEEIFATEVAERAGTIAWEILSRIGSRVARVYV